MKRKTLILIFSVLLIFTFCITSFAAVGDDTYGFNLLDDSVQNILYFSSSSGNSVGVNSHVVQLEDNSSYTFLSDIGIKNFYLAPIVDNVAYGYDSLNLYGIPVFSDTCVSSVTSDGFHYTNIGCVYANYKWSIPITSGVVSIGCDYYHDSGYSGGRSLGFEVVYTDGTIEEVNLLGVLTSVQSIRYTSDTSKIVSHVNVEVGDVSRVYLKDLYVREGNISSYVPFYGKVYHSSDLTSLYSFTTDKVYNDYALVFGSPHTGVIPDDNIFYLLSGNKSFSSLYSGVSESSYNIGFKDGYDNGYSVGQIDGLNSSKTFFNLIMAVVSIPFTIINSTLDFDFLGINVLNLIRVILTIMVIAWVFTRLKGRE